MSKMRMRHACTGRGCSKCHHPPPNASVEDLARFVLSDPSGAIARWKALPLPTKYSEEKQAVVCFGLEAPTQVGVNMHIRSRPHVYGADVLSCKPEDLITMVIRTPELEGTHALIQPERLDALSHGHAPHPLCNFVVDALCSILSGPPVFLRTMGVKYQPASIVFQDVTLGRLVRHFSTASGLLFAVCYLDWIVPTETDETGEAGRAIWFCANAACNKLDFHKKRCSGCKVAWYCSNGCQLADWKKGHKKECKEVSPM